MLHTEPSFSVYADGNENENENGVINIEQGDLLKGKEDNTSEFSFHKNIEYKKMVDDDPLNIVLLKNYAHHLQSNGDLNGAEEYYFRATQADPKDGETLMQYARLVWELHHDQDRALGYFEAAVLASPEDCDILGAYARFLWEIGDDEENDDTAAPTEESLEEYYKRVVNEKCRDPLLLRNYAHFLQQTKGDLEGAEEYYSRAVEADPGDGEVVSQYAQLVWELHRDGDKASAYFERAVEAAPTDSDVLAAHAKFLWEADDEDSEDH